LLQRFNRRTVIHSKAGKKLALALPTRQEAGEGSANAGARAKASTAVNFTATTRALPARWSFPGFTQLIAEPPARSMHTACAQYLQKTSSIRIGITSEDMVPLSEDWQFCLGWRVDEIRSAVVSTARMNPQYEGGAIAVANATARFEKVVKRISEFCTITRTPPEIREVSCSTES
jgi:hypothetical protein